MWRRVGRFVRKVLRRMRSETADGLALFAVGFGLQVPGWQWWDRDGDGARSAAEQPPPETESPEAAAPEAGEAGAEPGPGHPERLVADVPPTREERRLWRQIDFR